MIAEFRDNKRSPKNTGRKNVVRFVDKVSHICKSNVTTCSVNVADCVAVLFIEKILIGYPNQVGNKIN